MSLDITGKYTFRRSLQLKESKDGLLVLDTDSYTVHELNESAAAIARLCDGKTSCEEMVANIAAEFASDAHQAAEVVYRGLRLMLDQDLLESA